MKLKTKFSDISEFINELKTNNDILGIIEYGGRTFDNMNPGGDYDVSVVFNSVLSEKISGLHFHINDIPVDCMILSIDDFKTDYPDNPFMLAHIDGNILFDRNGEIATILDHVNKNWKLPRSLTFSEVSLFRFSFRHILDKLVNRLDEDSLYSNYFICASVDWMLECYARINGLQIGKPKSHLKYIKDNNLKLYEAIEEIYSSNDLKTKYSNLEIAFKDILKEYGGLWEKNEIIFHYMCEDELTDKEKEFILNKISIK